MATLPCLPAALDLPCRNQEYVNQLRYDIASLLGCLESLSPFFADLRTYGFGSSFNVGTQLTFRFSFDVESYVDAVRKEYVIRSSPAIG